MPVYELRPEGSISQMDYWVVWGAEVAGGGGGGGVQRP